MRNGRSPDVARDVANQIIREIEEKGIHCDWKDGEEAKEEVGEDEEWSSHSVWSDAPVQKNWSSTSTNDQFSYYNQFYPMEYYNSAERTRYYDLSYFQIAAS